MQKIRFLVGYQSFLKFNEKHQKYLNDLTFYPSYFQKNGQKLIEGKKYKLIDPTNTFYLSFIFLYLLSIGG